VPDTRDIALEARSKAYEAQRRLDRMNGSIDGLRDDVGTLRVVVEGIRTRVLIISAVAAAIGAAAASAVTLHFLQPDVRPLQQATQPAPARDLQDDQLVDPPVAEVYAPRR
jgi:hypothetical protein